MGYRIPIYGVQLIRERSVTVDLKKITCAEDAAKICIEYLEGVDREHFITLLLDTKHNLRGIHTVSVGSLDSSVVHPREVLKPAILANSSAIIIAHNHPSGDPTPSQEDIKVTHRLVEASRIIGIELLDHIIIGERRFVSLRTEGYI